MSLNLVLEAFCVVDVCLVAAETANVIATPDALKTNRTVKVLTFLKEERAVGPPAEFDCDPCVLAWIPLDLS